MTRCTVEDNLLVRLLEPLSKNDAHLIFTNLEKAQAKNSIEQFKEAKSLIDQISTCPVCREKAKFERWDRQAFKATCSNNDCKLEWGIYHSNEKSEVRFFTNDQISDGFISNGRWFDQFQL